MAKKSKNLARNSREILVIFADTTTLDHYPSPTQKKKVTSFIDSLLQPSEGVYDYAQVNW